MEDWIPELTDQINELKEGKYWESKDKRLLQLINTNEIVTILLDQIRGELMIQEIVSILVFQLSKDLNTEESVKNVIDVLEVCNDIFYMITTTKPIQILSMLPTFSLNKGNEPLLVPPKRWNSRDPECILGSFYNKNDERKSVDVLNKLQEIELELDPYILSMDEEPKKEDLEYLGPFLQRVQAAREIYKDYINTFYFEWKMDKRGRMYSTGYHINIQSGSYQKALINFKEKELIQQ